MTEATFDRTASAHEIRGPVRVSGRAAVETTVGRRCKMAGVRPPRSFVWFQSPVELAEAWASRISLSGPNLRRELLDAPLDRAAELLPRPEPRRMMHAQIAWPVPSSAPAHGLDQTIADIAAGSTFSSWMTRVMARRRLRGFALAGFGPSSVTELKRASARLLAHGDAEYAERCEHLAQLAGKVGWIVPHERSCWIAEPCRYFKTDGDGRLHSAKSPAAEFADGLKIYAWKGVVLPGWIIESPERLNTSVVDYPYDLWVRRCMIDIITPERFIAEGGADCFAADETGRLWRRRWWNPTENTSDAWAAVEVVNGTPELDGSHKRYYLQVPPEVRSPREAVAWTYGLNEAQYTALAQRT